jgi:hypothetical protein
MDVALANGHEVSPANKPAGRDLVTRSTSTFVEQSVVDDFVCDALHPVHPASNEERGAPLGSGACRGRPRVPNYCWLSILRSAATRKRFEVCARTMQRAEAASVRSWRSG